MIKILFIIGTRPEAIKMLPVIKKFVEHLDKFKVVLIVTAQHREMLDQVLVIFELRADYDLNIMTYKQSLSDITIAALKGLEKIIEKECPDYVFVQGDTTTTFVGALAAFYHKIPVAHIEAGLRTYDNYQPFPEEINRTLTSVLANIHFAPTEWAKQNLIKEGIQDGKIYVVGNTVIDSLLMVVKKRKPYFNRRLQEIVNKENSNIILLTAHRRENFGEPLENICNAVIDITEKFNDVQVVYPVHKNPNVRNTVFNFLKNRDRIHLIDPMDYESFVHIMNRSDIILTDSGGIQEEAPSLGKPVLVLRNTTERPEGLKAGTIKLVGLNKDTIVNNVAKLLTDKEYYNSISRITNPYGDGRSSERIVNHFINIISKSEII